MQAAQGLPVWTDGLSQASVQARICLPDSIPRLGVDSGETVQLRQVRRWDPDGIPWLPGEGCLVAEDGIDIERVGQRHSDSRPPEDSPNSAALIIACVVSVRCIGPPLLDRGHTRGAADLR